MDSLATLDLPAVGYGIRYEYGIFEQDVEDGQQVERRDPWLQYGNPWEVARHEDAQVVRFYGHVRFRHDDDGRLRVDWLDTRKVIGLPHDSFIVGHDTDTVNTLRLSVAHASRDFDLGLFNQGEYWRAVEEKVEVENISKVLYPNDSTEQGKELRLKQQYFFVACSVADIVRVFKKTGHPWEMLPERAAIQLNDTHPSIAIAELMRVLVDHEQLGWDASWAITTKTFGYTNHTLLPEALERWPLALFERVLPRHALIIREIDRRFLIAVQRHWPGNTARQRRMAIVEEGAAPQVRMAHLATVGSHSINGVAKLHSDLLKRELLCEFFELWPERFNNKTNGITPRRWLLYANPQLANLVSRRLGTSWLPANLRELERLRDYADDVSLLDALAQIKLENKRRLAPIVHNLTGVEIDPGAMSSYFMAKLHIRLINDMAQMLNGDPDTNQRLRVVFVPNYGVSLAQSIIPAADLSLQISQAGKEASGTSNMKFALNGALTLGTLVCADYADYVARETEAAALYGNPRSWGRRSLLNIAGASAFSSDATIRAYADEIWNIRPQSVELRDWQASP